MGNSSGAGVTPARNFLKAFSPGLLEEPDAVAGMLEFVNVRPYLGLPGVIMDGTCPAGGAPGVELFGNIPRAGRFRQFYKNATNLRVLRKLRGELRIKDFKT